MSELTSISAKRMGELIRKKEVSSEQLVTAHLQQIAEVNPKINAVVHACAERALAQARQRDDELAGGMIRGPLHGVPVTIKDSLETAGVVTTSGTLGRANHVPEKDASTVALLREAGAVVIAKTNVPELCLAFESDNLIHGRTVNPYDLTRTSGGSSGGEAAIIAACGSPLGLGSDAGGSVRLPAHFCGITALKPTSGRLPKTGHYLPPGGIADRLWQVGPMARYVEDLALSLPILARADGVDASVVPMPVGNPSAVPLEKLRVAFYTDNGVRKPTAETMDAVRHAAEAVAAAGAMVEEARPDGADTPAIMWCDLLGADGGAGLRALLDSIGTTRVHPLLSEFLEIARQRAMSTGAFLDLMARWDTLRTRMTAFLDRYDAIICPVAALPAIEPGTSYSQLDIFSYTMLFNFTGWPAASLRCATSPEGLPIGVQVAAAPWREDIVLRLAQYLESAFGGWKAPS